MTIFYPIPINLNSDFAHIWLDAGTTDLAICLNVDNILNVLVHLIKMNY